MSSWNHVPFCQTLEASYEPFEQVRRLASIERDCRFVDTTERRPHARVFFVDALLDAVTDSVDGPNQAIEWLWAPNHPVHRNLLPAMHQKHVRGRAVRIGFR